MSNPELLAVLALGTALMCIPISLQMKWYRIAAWKSIVVSLVLVLTGVLGSKIWFFVENGHFNGRSFYGAVFLAPLVYWPVSGLMKIPYGQIMDFCAPAGCLTLAMVKVQCLRDRCCEGIALYVDENFHYVRFPSEIVEMTVFLIIAFILLLVCSKTKNRTKGFPWFLVLYGSTRFVLDYFRSIRPVYALGLSAGSFWSLIALSAGIGILLWMQIGNKKKLVENAK